MHPETGSIFLAVWGLVSILGLFSYSYKKKSFSAEIWKYLFYITLILDIIDILYEFAPGYFREFTFMHPHPSTLKPEFYALFAILLNAPILYAMYKLSKNTLQAVKKGKKRVKGKG
jgi:hypothetical protein